MQNSTKESFLIFKAFYEPIKNFTDKDLGQLFRMLFEYQINPKNPVGFTVNPNVKMAFEFFRNQFRLDDEKYQKVIERNRQNGQNGGRPRVLNETQSNPKNPVGFLKPKKPDNDNDNATENETEINKQDSEKFEVANFEGSSSLQEVVNHYNQAFNKQITSTAGFEKNFEYWIKTHPVEKITTAITNARSDNFWKDKLTLSILFRRKNPRGEQVDYIEDLSNRIPSHGIVGIV